MKHKLESIVTDLENHRDQVIESLENLKKDWNTAAGKSFMKNVNTDWTKEVEKYIKIVGGVEDLLNEAATQYQKVEEEIDRLKFYS